MGSKFRFVADVQKTREIIDSGILGDIILYENTFAGFCDMSKRWNSQPAISGGGVLIDNGTHSVDILRFLLGNITELQVVEGKRIQNLPVEDTALIFARTEGGAMGNIDLSWSLNKVRADFISIYGSKGTLSVGWKESKYKLADQREWTVFGNGYDKVAAFGNQIKNFGGAICGTEELIITPIDAIASVRVIETAYAALRSEKWHTVTPAAQFRRTTISQHVVSH
jgi:predicted dehydrogenase